MSETPVTPADPPDGASDASFGEIMLAPENDIPPAVPVAWIGPLVASATIIPRGLDAGPGKGWSEADVTMDSGAGAAILNAAAMPETADRAGRPARAEPEVPVTPAPARGETMTGPSLDELDAVDTRYIDPARTSADDQGAKTLPDAVAKKPDPVAGSALQAQSHVLMEDAAQGAILAVPGTREGTSMTPAAKGDPGVAGARPSAETDVEVRMSDPGRLDDFSRRSAGQADWIGNSELAADPALGPDAIKADVRIGAADDDPAAATVTDLHADPLDPEPPVSRSFWERFFVSATFPESPDMLAADGALRSDQSLLFSAVATSGGAILPVSSAMPAIPWIVADTQPLAEAVRAPESLPEDEPLPGVSLRSPAQPDSSALPVPLVVVSGWMEGPADPGEQAETTLSLAPGATSDVRHEARSTPQTARHLPVPEVAAQLAGVLVSSAGSVTELALAPEELGRVKLRFEPDAANPDRMVILINVERPDTLDLFRRHAGELAEAIRAAGYSGADIGFDQHRQDRSPGQQKDSVEAGQGLPGDDPGNTPTVPRLGAGASLDLRL